MNKKMIVIEENRILYKKTLISNLFYFSDNNYLLIINYNLNVKKQK